MVPRASSAPANSEGSGINHRTIRESREPIAPWLLNSDEGLEIIGAALESRQHTDSNADCSNLVHAIYERAGFTYPYANSTEIYGGIKEFRRVTHPQPGDLVVWRGHVGIMISPARHTFFSAMRSGRGVEVYDSPYWAARGRPRFFRYLKPAVPAQYSAAAHNANSQPSSSRSTESYDPTPADEDFGLAPAVSSARPASRTSTAGPSIDVPAAAPTERALSSSRVSGATPPASNSERQTAHHAQGPVTGHIGTRTGPKAEGMAVDSPESAMSSQMPRKLSGAVATPARPYVPRPPASLWGTEHRHDDRTHSRENGFRGRLAGG